MDIITDLEKIQLITKENEEENDFFLLFLKRQNTLLIDEIVHDLNVSVSSKIDCTQCGNCCMTLMIQVEKNEIDIVAAKLNLTVNEFRNKFIETGLGDKMLMNSIPCAFLSDTKCSVYNERFSSCKEFPGLHLPHFTDRLFTVFMHYGRCPIIFNVIESLKELTSFHSSDE